jgi:hypothetical protein
MTPEEKRIAIAEACGWKFDTEFVWFPSGTRTERNMQTYDCAAMEDILMNILPNYLNDLNAMHKAENTLPQDNSLHGRVAYDNKLMRICGSHQACVSATATQRADAFLKTIGKFKEDK